MYEFGDEAIIGSYKVPWLIWIQLLVMILLVLLLFFGFSILDLPNNSSNYVASSSTISGSSHGNPPSNSTTTIQRRNQNQHTKRETEASTSREVARADGSEERERSAEKDANVFKLLVRPQHPCNYFGLAKQAFLKCLGIDSDRDNCNARRHSKED